MMMENKFVLENATGLYYKHEGFEAMEGPAFCSELKRAKRMTEEEAKAVQLRLKNENYHGEHFEIKRV